MASNRVVYAKVHVNSRTGQKSIMIPEENIDEDRKLSGNPATIKITIPTDPMDD